jgi:hypothetical protein
MQPSLLLQWVSNISPIKHLNLNGVILTVTQGAGMVSACKTHLILVALTNNTVMECVA